MLQKEFYILATMIYYWQRIIFAEFVESCYSYCKQATTYRCIHHAVELRPKTRKIHFGKEIVNLHFWTNKLSSTSHSELHVLVKENGLRVYKQ